MINTRYPLFKLALVNKVRLLANELMARVLSREVPFEELRCLPLALYKALPVQMRVRGGDGLVVDARSLLPLDVGAQRFHVILYLAHPYIYIYIYIYIYHIMSHFS